MFAKRFIMRLFSVLWVFALTLSLAQPAYAASLQITQTESAIMLQHTLINSAINDPNLIWNTFQGGNGVDNGGVRTAVDSNGNIYVSGFSGASWGTPVRAYSGSYDAFVAKFNTNGALLWNTFLGGSDFDMGYGIVVDGSGNVVVSGDCQSTWGTPVRAFSGSKDAFVAKLNSVNGALIWNTFLGQSGTDDGGVVAIDSSDNIYTSGDSERSWGTPVRAYTGPKGLDAFYAKLNPNGTLIWNTFLGSANDDQGNGIAVDASDHVVVDGWSAATWGSPIRGISGGIDAFVAKLNASSGALQWNTFLGGSGSDNGHGIAVDSGGNIYLNATSNATWGTPIRAYSGGTDVFVAKLSPTGGLTWNTFLGGSGDDDRFGADINVDGSGHVVLTGSSTSTWGTPVRAYSGGWDAFIARLSPSGTLQTNTFLGGSRDDEAWGIDLDSSNHIIVVGKSGDTWGAPIHTFISGSLNIFVAKTSLPIPPPGASTLVSPLATVTTGKPTFIWSKVETATLYRLWIKNSGGAWVVQNLYSGQNICGATNCAMVSPVTLANGTYTWYIQTLTNTQNGAWSAHAFTVAIPTPGMVTLVAPKGTIHTATPTFIWSKDNVATLYRLWVKDSSGTWVIQKLLAGANICGSTNCAIVSPSTLANGSYTWYIQTLTATQNGQWSAQAITVSVPDEVPAAVGGDEGVK